MVLKILIGKNMVYNNYSPILKHGKINEILDEKTGLSIYSVDDFEIHNDQADESFPDLYIDYPTFLYDVCTKSSLYHGTIDIFGAFLFIKSIIKDLLPTAIVTHIDDSYYKNEIIDENIINGHLKNDNIFLLELYKKINKNNNILIFPNYKKIYIKKIYLISLTTSNFLNHNLNNVLFNNKLHNEFYVEHISILVNDFIKKTFEINDIEKNKKIYISSKTDKIINDVSKYLGINFLAAKENIHLLPHKLQNDLKYPEELERMLTKNDLNKFLDFIQSLGYIIFDPLKLTFEDQIKFIGSAEYVLTAAGSNSIHSAFVNKNANFIYLNLTKDYSFIRHQIFVKSAKPDSIIINNKSNNINDMIQYLEQNYMNRI